MFNEIIEYHMDQNEYPELIQACKKYGFVAVFCFYFDFFDEFLIRFCF